MQSLTVQNRISIQIAKNKKTKLMHKKMCQFFVLHGEKIGDILYDIYNFLKID